MKIDIKHLLLATSALTASAFHPLQAIAVDCNALGGTINTNCDLSTTLDSAITIDDGFTMTLNSGALIDQVVSVQGGATNANIQTDGLGIEVEATADIGNGADPISNLIIQDGDQLIIHSLDNIAVDGSDSSHEVTVNFDVVSIGNESVFIIRGGDNLTAQGDLSGFHNNNGTISSTIGSLATTGNDLTHVDFRGGNGGFSEDRGRINSNVNVFIDNMDITGRTNVTLHGGDNFTDNDQRTNSINATLSVTNNVTANDISIFELTGGSQLSMMPGTFTSNGDIQSQATFSVAGNFSTEGTTDFSLHGGDQLSIASASSGSDDIDAFVELDIDGTLDVEGTTHFDFSAGSQISVDGISNIFSHVDFDVGNDLTTNGTTTFTLQGGDNITTTNNGDGEAYIEFDVGGNMTLNGDTGFTIHGGDHVSNSDTGSLVDNFIDFTIGGNLVANSGDITFDIAAGSDISNNEGDRLNAYARVLINGALDLDNADQKTFTLKGGDDVTNSKALANEEIVAYALFNVVSSSSLTLDAGDSITLHAGDNAISHYNVTEPSPIFVGTAWLANGNFDLTVNDGAVIDIRGGENISNSASGANANDVLVGHMFADAYFEHDSGIVTINDGAQISITGGSITKDVGNRGIEASAYMKVEDIEMNGGTLTLQGGQAVDSEDNAHAFIETESITISGTSNITIGGGSNSASTGYIDALTIAVDHGDININPGGTLQGDTFSGSNATFTFGIATEDSAGFYQLDSAAIDFDGNMVRADATNATLTDGDEILIAQGNSAPNIAASSATSAEYYNGKHIEDISAFWDFSIHSGGDLGEDINQVFLVASASNACINDAVDVVMSDISNGNTSSTPSLKNSIDAVASLGCNEQYQEGKSTLLLNVELLPFDNIKDEIESHMARYRDMDYRNGVATGDVHDGLQFWGNAIGHKAEKNEDNNTAGYRFNSVGFAGGADTQSLVKNATIGVSLGYTQSWIEGEDSNRSKNTIDSYHFTGYMEKTLSPTRFVSTMLGYVHSNNETRRHHIVGQDPSAVAVGEFASHQYLAQLEIGENFQYKNNITITPSLLAYYVLYQADEYSEHGAGGANLKDIQYQDIEKFEIGGDIDFKWSHPKAHGDVLEPEIRLGYRYDLIADPLQVTTGFAGGGDRFSIVGADPERYSINLGTGITYHKSNESKLSLDYDFEFRSAYEAHTFSLRGRVPIFHEK